MFKYKLLIPLMLFSLVGCVSTPPFNWGVCNTSEYSIMRTVGNGHITGEAFLKAMNGDIHYASGNHVHLNPVTSYTTRWFDQCLVAKACGKRIPDPDPVMVKFRRVTTADSNGQFEFNNLPAGDYYIFTSVTWVIQTGTLVLYGVPIPITSTQGGVIAKKITVTETEDTRIILTW